MIEEIHEKGDDGLHIKLVLALMGLDVRDIEVLKHEQFDNYTYVYNYRLSYGTSDYREVYTNIRAAFFACEDPDSSNGYKISYHLYEGSNMLW